MSWQEMMDRLKRQVASGRCCVCGVSLGPPTPHPLTGFTTTCADGVAHTRCYNDYLRLHRGVYARA